MEFVEHAHSVEHIYESAIYEERLKYQRRNGSRLASYENESVEPGAMPVEYPEERNLWQIRPEAQSEENKG